MPRRKVDLDTKVQAMRECLQLTDVEAVTHKYHLSERTAYSWFAQILERLPDILQNESPGPKRQSDTLTAPPRQRRRSAKPWAVRDCSG